MIIEFNTTPKRSGEYIYTTMKWDLTNQLNVEDFLNKHPNTFVKVGRIVGDAEKSCGYRIDVADEWKNKSYVLYLVVVHGKILKGGKSKNPLPLRTYGAGTEENWTMKGSPSDTNYIYSQIFRQCVKDGVEVEFYAMACPVTTIDFDFLGVTKTQEVSPYEEMEQVLNATLNEQLGRPLIGHGDLMEQHKI